MNNINFYEVQNKNGHFMGAYSTQFDSEIQLGIGSLQMAIINAKQSGGTIFSVSYDNEREQVWPK